MDVNEDASLSLLELAGSPLVRSWSGGLEKAWAILLAEPRNARGAFDVLDLDGDDTLTAADLVAAMAAGAALALPSPSPGGGGGSSKAPKAKALRFTVRLDGLSASDVPPTVGRVLRQAVWALATAGASDLAGDSTFLAPSFSSCTPPSSPAYPLMQGICPQAP